MPNRPQRHAEILRIIRRESISSQEKLKDRLHERGYAVTQATLSRDLRSLGVVKVADPAGGSHYAVPADVLAPTPTLASLLPTLCTALDGVDNLLVMKTLPGGAQPLAVAIDGQEWSEVVGTVAGDDTILIITRSASAQARLSRRIAELAGLHTP